MRKLLFAVALLLGVFFLFGRLGEMQAIAETRKTADWRYLLLALVMQGVWLVNIAATFRAIYRALGIQERTHHLLLMVASANFVNIVAPSAGMGGMAVLIAEARRRNYSPARVTVAAAVYVLFDYVGFICVLALGLIVLIRRNNLNWVEVTASAILVSIAVVLALLLYLGTRSGEAMGRALAWMVRLVNRLLRPFIRREYLSEGRARSFAHDAAEGLQELKSKPTCMLIPALLALANKALMVGILFVIFLAFSVPISVGTVVASFSIGYLFLIISPTPSGIGFVEGAMTLALYSMYIPLIYARDITLAYRGVTFYIPLLFGFVALRLLEMVPVEPDAEGAPETKPRGLERLMRRLGNLLKTLM